MFSIAKVKKPIFCNVHVSMSRSWSCGARTRSRCALENLDQRTIQSRGTTWILNLFLRPARSKYSTFQNVAELSSSHSIGIGQLSKLRVGNYLRFTSILGYSSSNSNNTFVYNENSKGSWSNFNGSSCSRHYSDNKADLKLKIHPIKKPSSQHTKTESSSSQTVHKPFSTSHIIHGRGGKSSKNKEKGGGAVSHLFVPVPLKPVTEGHAVGAELSGKLNKAEVLKVLNKFFRRSEIKLLSLEHGLDNYLFHQAFISFRKMCLEADNLPVEVHIVFSDVIQGAGHVDDLFPYFIQHAKQIFPHLDCMEDLKKISDLRSPANWYPEARSIKRKIIFHAGPTNSGKTYHALERFLNSYSGVYCGPLKLLASEVYQTANDKGTPCDLVTGEERRMANIDQETPSTHVACTVEMTSVTQPYECAIIDEIQMLRDPQRGWAWTRALLGVMAEEVHLCGEPAAIELVKSILVTTGEDAEVREYKRLTALNVEKKALGSLDNVQPGDCIVCFSKNDIYSVSRQIERKGREVAVIYGGLPPGTKLAQAQKFNDPENPCKILVATDAIGMGLNLSIRRVIFYSLTKPSMNEKGEREVSTVSVSQCLQIAGRAGRYGTHFAEGHVTCFKKDDLLTLQRLMGEKPDSLVQAGLHPTADQIEMYAYHLPNATLSNLMDIFVNLCTVDDSLYFMCNVGDFKYLADMIQHIPLPLRARYVFCCAPINRRMPFVCAMFLKFARQYSKNEPITFDWLCHHIGWPFNPPETIAHLIELEAIFDVLDLYLWLSYRFQDLFPDAGLVRDTQKELDGIIQMGVFNITTLLKNSDKIEISNE